MLVGLGANLDEYAGSAETLECCRSFVAHSSGRVNPGFSRRAD
jgi:hypothetical protein